MQHQQTIGKRIEKRQHKFIKKKNNKTNKRTQ